MNRPIPKGATLRLGLGCLSVGTHARRVVVVLVLVALVVATALVSWMAHGERVKRDRADAATSAVAAELVRILSWTPKNVLSDLPSEEKLLSGDFASQYADLVHQTIAPATRASGLTSTAQIRAAGVISQDGDRVDLLYFVNVTVTGKSKTADPVGSRLRVTAVEKDGMWRIEKYDPV